MLKFCISCEHCREIRGHPAEVGTRSNYICCFLHVFFFHLLQETQLTKLDSLRCLQ